MDILDILDIIRTILFSLIVVLSLIYSTPVLFVRRFRRRTDIFTLNICLGAICCSIYYIIFFVIHDYHIELILIHNICMWLTYLRMMSSCQIAFTFITVSINRLVSMIYYLNPFFKTKRWIFLCIICQWILGLIIPLPIFSSKFPYCSISRWISIYIMLMVVVLPSLTCFVVNIQIFVFVRSVSRRIQPPPGSIHMNTNQVRSQIISRRDIHLLLHIALMLSMFTLGWGPIFLVSILDYNIQIAQFVSPLLIILAELSLLCDIINLFYYNQTLRQYLRNKFL